VKKIERKNRMEGKRVGGWREMRKGEKRNGITVWGGGRRKTRRKTNEERRRVERHEEERIEDDKEGRNEEKEKEWKRERGGL
jgi:hypothetical protein